MKLIKNIIVFSLVLGLNSCKKIEKISNQKKEYEFNSFDILTKNDPSYTKYNLSDKNKKALNDFYKITWEANNLSGGILIAQGNTILFEKYRGLADIKNNKIIDENTPIHIASVSKIFTSLAILKFVELNKIKLNQKVNTILKDFPYDDIRVIDLLNHRSGLINYSKLAEMEFWWDLNKNLTNKDVYNLYSVCKPYKLFPADKQFLYTNSNFVILAQIIEKITNEKFPTVIQNMVFDPFEMKNTFIYDEKYSSKISFSYFSNGMIYPFDRYDLIYGDKNVYSTPRDLYKLSSVMFSDKFMRKSLLDSMFIGYSNEKKGINNYGLGMRLKIYDTGKKIVYHTGLWHGNNAIFIHLKDENLTIIALGNKKSKAIYSAMSLASLFGNYPFEKPKMDSIINKNYSQENSEIIKDSI